MRRGDAWVSGGSRVRRGAARGGVVVAAQSDERLPAIDGACSPSDGCPRAPRFTNQTRPMCRHVMRFRRRFALLALDDASATRIGVRIGAVPASLRARRDGDRPFPPSARPAREVGSRVGPARRRGSTHAAHESNTGAYSLTVPNTGSTSGAAAARRCASTGPTAAARTCAAARAAAATAPRTV